MHHLSAASSSRFVGQTAKYSIGDSWFSSATRVTESKLAPRDSTSESDERRRRFVSLWHGRDWTKVLASRSNIRESDGLAVVSYGRFSGLARPVGRMRSAIADRSRTLLRCILPSNSNTPLAKSQPLPASCRSSLSFWSAACTAWFSRPAHQGGGPPSTRLAKHPKRCQRITFPANSLILRLSLRFPAPLALGQTLDSGTPGLAKAMNN